MLYVPSWHSTMYPLPFEKFSMQLKYVQMSPCGLVTYPPDPQKLYPYGLLGAPQSDCCTGAACVVGAGGGGGGAGELDVASTGAGASVPGSSDGDAPAPESSPVTLVTGLSWLVGACEGARHPAPPSATANARPAAAPPLRTAAAP